MSNYQTERTKASARLRQVEQSLTDAKRGLQHEASLSSDERIRLREARDNAMSEKGQLEIEMSRLDRLIIWQRDIDNADATIKTSRKKIVVAQKETAKLGSNREKVAARLAKVNVELSQLQGQASQSEQAAARDYAAALASGDEGAERAAEAKLERAADAVDGAQRAALRQQPMINALTSELQSIEDAQAEAVRQLQLLEQEQLSAVRLKLIADWDAAAKALIELGGKLSAVGSFGAGSSTILDDLHIPLLGLDASGSINRQEIDRRASTIQRSDLVGV
ncbi:MAG: hypothetical protein M3Q94_03360 [Pseudomonadota bacterium]|nr:hypothetical protein [Pseudomonadota bacterium]